LTPHPLVELLKEKGVCRRAALVEEGAECSLVACVADNYTILLAAVSLPETRYVKAVPEDCIPPDMWACNTLFYTPYGLYAYGDTWEVVVEKLRSKLRRLDLQLRECRERMQVAK